MQTGIFRYPEILLPNIILEYNQFSLFVVVRFQQGFVNTKLMITEPSFLGECRVGFFELLVTTF